MRIESIVSKGAEAVHNSLFPDALAAVVQRRIEADSSLQHVLFQLGHRLGTGLPQQGASSTAIDCLAMVVGGGAGFLIGRHTEDSRTVLLAAVGEAAVGVIAFIFTREPSLFVAGVSAAAGTAIGYFFPAPVER